MAIQTTFSCWVKGDQRKTRNIRVSQLQLCRTPQTRCCVTRGGHDTQTRRVLGVWLVELELKLPPEHENTNRFTFSCPGGPNTPNTMLCHKGRVRHADASCFGCLAGGGGELELENHPNTKTRIDRVFARVKLVKE